MEHQVAKGVLYSEVWRQADSTHDLAPDDKNAVDESEGDDVSGDDSESGDSDSDDDSDSEDSDSEA